MPWPRPAPSLSRADRATAAAALGVAAALLTGCAGTPGGSVGSGGVAPDTSRSARAQESRVQFLVLHYTYADTPTSLKVLTEDDVSSHYLLTDESPPRLYRLVDEDRRAWHAGVSFWGGARLLNSSSIGIEIVNPGLRPGPDGTLVQPPFTEAQMQVLVPLVADIVRRHAIRPDRVLGHSDIAPQRKQDPGPQFPWARLAAAGLVLWPEPARVAAARPAHEAALPDVAWFQRQLAAHGFEVPSTGVLDEPTRRVLAAFQMKYRPARFDGTPDAETAALLEVLVAMAPR